ncbi:MAG: hypothetical protein WCV91_00840 [Candidatus Margulisiibacteriota bacterium]
MKIEANKLNNTGIGSLLNDFNTGLTQDFKSIMLQLADGKAVKIPGNEKEYSVENDMFALTLGLQQWNKDMEFITDFMWKAYKFNDKLTDQINSVASS